MEQSEAKVSSGGRGRHLVVANGVRLGYQVSGYGPPLLLLLGYRLGGRAWPNAFIDTLAEEFEVIALDNRGTGDSVPSGFGFSIADLARDAAGLLDALGIGSAHVLGYSMGGAIAQELCCAFPGHVDKLVLCNTWSGLFSSVQVEYANLDEWAALWREPWRPMSRFWSTMRLFQPDRSRTEEHLASEATGMMQVRAMLGFEILSRLGSIGSPSLVIAGSDDRIVSPRNGALIAERIPGSRFHLMPDVGHRAVWEQPEAMARIVAAFLRRG